MPYKDLNFIKKNIFSRNNLILKLIKDKKVIHYGCVDDSKDIIDRQILKGNYLHKLVTDNSKWCIGIDENRELINYLRNQYSMNNIFYGNVEDINAFEYERKYLLEVQILLIPDVIEHLCNPGKMLEDIISNYPKSIKIIITTPNPFMYQNFICTIKRKEVFSEYHTCYFSTNNMKVLLSRYGIRIRKVYPYWVPDRGKVSKIFPFGKRNISNMIGNFLFLFSKNICDGYLYECEVDWV